MSLGIPSTSLGAGGREGFNHSLSEWFEPVRSYEGPQLCLFDRARLVGLEKRSRSYASDLHGSAEGTVAG